MVTDAATDRKPAPGRAPLLDRLPPWAFLALLGFVMLLMWLITLTGPDNFVTKKIWEPIVEDEGYNPTNTVLLMVVLGCILGWLLLLMRKWGETVDLELTVAVVPYLVWGSIFRVLEDSDLFGPFSENIASSGVNKPGGSSCIQEVGGSFLHHCFGVFFITPIIYVIVTLFAVLFLWLGRHAKTVSLAHGPAAGLRFFGLTLVGILALYMALWAGDQTFVRWVASPVVALAACAVAYLLVWRDTSKRGHVNPRWAMFAYAMVWFIVGLYYVIVWMNGGHAATGRGVMGLKDWRPTGTPQWWVFAALVLSPLFVSLCCARIGRAFAKPNRPDGTETRRAAKPDGHISILAVLVVLQGIAMFVSILAFDTFEQKLRANTMWSDVAGAFAILGQFLVGPAFFVAAVAGSRVLAAGRLGHHPALLFFANPVNLLMLFGQAADALMTSLGIDVFQYHEKHVLPGFLIEYVDNLNIPGILGHYPAAMVMIPLKILIVLAVVWLIDIGSTEDADARRNLIGLVKLSIIMVGLSPGVRDAVRLAMAT